MLKEACGRQHLIVTFGESSYSSSSKAIGQAIQRLLSSTGNIESWTMSSSTKSAQSKATATFSTMEQAAIAITEFNGYKLPQLGGSKILLSHLIKAKFSILSSMHSAISSELVNVQQSFRSNNYLEIKSYPSADKTHRFTTLHIISDTAQVVGKAKAAVEKILNGHTARGGKDLIWYELFLKPEGMAYLNDLGKQHNVFIYSPSLSNTIPIECKPTQCIFCLGCEGLPAVTRLKSFASPGDLRKHFHRKHLQHHPKYQSIDCPHPRCAVTLNNTEHLQNHAEVVHKTRT